MPRTLLISADSTLKCNSCGVRYPSDFLGGGTKKRQQKDIGTVNLRAATCCFVTSNSTIGFQALSKLMRKKDSSLKRMLGPTGKPAPDNVFAITRLLQDREGLELKVVS